jgi:hypothetical protein
VLRGFAVELDFQPAGQDSLSFAVFDSDLEGDSVSAEPLVREGFCDVGTRLALGQLLDAGADVLRFGVACRRRSRWASPAAGREYGGQGEASLQDLFGAVPAAEILSVVDVRPSRLHALLAAVSPAWRCRAKLEMLSLAACRVDVEAHR